MKIGLHAGTIDLVPDVVQTVRSPLDAKTVYKAPLTVRLYDTSRSIDKKIAIVATIELSAQTAKSGVARLLVKTSMPWPVATPDELGNIRVDTSRDVSFHSVLTLPRGATAAIRSGNESFLHCCTAFCTSVVEALIAPLFVRSNSASGAKRPFSVGTSDLEFRALTDGAMTWYDTIKGAAFNDMDWASSGQIALLPDLIKGLATGIAPTVPDQGANALKVPSAYISG